MNQKTSIESDSYAYLLNEAHKQGLGEIYTQIIIFPQENKNKALVWARITLSKGSFSALAEADSLEEAEHKAKHIALSEALNKAGEAKEEKPAETLASGKAQNTQSSALSQESKESQSSQNGAESQESFEPMSEAQRRYLLRLLADRGLKGNPAYEKLKSMFGVASLKEVNKSQASQKIQEMLNSQESAQSIPGGKNI